jgi:hypothetical protein
MEAMQWFVVVIIAQLFFSIGITMLTHAIPSDDLRYVTSYSDLANSINAEELSGSIQGSMKSQTSIPLIEVGALVFYTGNLILDLLLNFAFATPQMVTLFLTGITKIIGLDAVITGSIQLYLTAVIGILYFVLIIRLLANLRSGTQAIG